MEGQARAGRQRFLAHHMAPLLGETRDQSASSNITAGKREWHLDFVTGTVATLHECLLLSKSAGFGPGRLEDGYAVRRRNQPPFPSVTPGKPSPPVPITSGGCPRSIGIDTPLSVSYFAALQF